MKRIIKYLFLMMCLIACDEQISAQSLVRRIEYFIDSDPGIGNGQIFTFPTATNDTTVSFLLQTQSLLPGLHTLFVRAQDDAGKNSVVQRSSFFILPSPANLSSAEYFVDADPGVGNAQQISISSNSTDTTLTFNLNTSTLSAGLHTLFVRTKNAAGQYGVVQRHSFFVAPTTSNLAAAEYFVDADPGVGNGLQIPISASSFDTTLSFNLNTAALSGGLHTLFVRTKNTAGQYSVVQRHSFFVAPTTPNLAAAEYFVDADPGVGNGQQIPISANSFDTTLSFNLNTAALSGGLHTLFVRTKNTVGQYSVVQRHSFFVAPTTPNLAAAEYFVDADPGVGNGQQIPISANSSDTSLVFNLNTAALSNGLHTLFVRTKNTGGQYSVVQRSPFFVLPNTPNISSVEYFIDTDPGVGNGQNFAITPTSSDTSILATVNTTSLSYGLHKMYARVKNQNNQWSVVQSTSFYHLITPAKPKTLEYYIDTDPGFGNGTAITLNAGADTAYATFQVNLNSVSLGSHRLYVRAKDSLGYWGLLVDSSFCKTPGANFTVPSSVCVGQTFTLTNTSTDTTSTTTYAWDIGNDGSIDRSRKDTIQLNFSDTGFKYIKLKINTPGTCASDSIIKSIYVNPSLSLTAGISASVTNTCAGNLIRFIATTVNGGATPLFQWRKNGINISGATDDTLNISTLIDKDTITCLVTTSLTSCMVNTTILTNKIGITITPVVTPTISISTPTTNICSGRPVLFTASFTHGGTSPSFQWMLNGAVIPGATNDSLTLSSLSNNDTVSCQLTSSLSSCTTSSIVLSNKIGLGVTPTLTPAIAITAGNTSICAGTAVTFFATLVNEGSNPVIAWYQNNLVVAGQTGTTYILNNPSQNDSVYATLMSSATCVAASTVSSSKIGITVKTITPAVVTSTSSSFCTGGGFTKIMMDTTAGATYRWMRDNIEIQSSTNPEYFVTFAGNYRGILTNSNGCSDTSSAITITAKPTPIIRLNQTTDTSFCEGSSFMLTVDSAIIGSATYQWKRNATTLSSITNELMVTQSGSYTVTATSATTGCQATSAPVNINSAMLPSVALNVTGSINMCQGSTTQLVANAAADISYQWYTGTSAISGATDRFYQTNTAGTFRVLVANTQCSQLSDSVVVLMNAKPTLNMTGNSSRTSYCENDSIRLSGNAITGIAPYTYTWFNNNAAIQTGSTLTINQTGVYRLVVVDSLGCKDSSAPFSYTFYNNPIAHITVTGNLQYCKPIETLRLDADTGSGNTYTWYKSDYDPENTTAEPDTVAATGVSSISNPAWGKYYVEVTSANGCKNNSTAVMVNGYTKPTAILSSTASQSICSGQPVRVVLSPSGFGSENSLLLNDTVYIPILADSSALLSSSGTYKLVSTIPAIAGCSDTSSSSFTVAVKESPSATLSTLNPVQCLSDNLFIFYPENALQNPQTTVYTYAFGDGQFKVQPATDHSYTSAGKYHVMLIATNAGNCSDTGTLEVKVGAQPVASIAVNNPSLCTGSGDFIFTNTGTQADSNTSVLWKMGDGNLLTGNTFTHRYPQTGSYTVTLSSTSIDGCSNEDSITVEFNPKPRAKFDYTVLGSTVGFTNQSSIASGALQYNWDLGNGEQSVAQALTYNYPLAGTYRVALIAMSDKGCVDSTSKTITITLQPVALYLPFFPSAGGSFYTAGGYTLASTIGELTMVQTFADTLKPIVLTQGFQQPDDFFNILNGLDDQPQQPLIQKGSFTLFPNPSTGPLFIGYEFTSAGRVTCVLYDQLGRLVTNLLDEEYQSGKITQSFDVSGYREGIYYIRTVFRGETETTHTQKLIITH